MGELIQKQGGSDPMVGLLLLLGGKGKTAWVCRYILSFFLTVLFLPFQTSLAWAEGLTVKTSNAPMTIEARWDSMWGMGYFQNGQELKGDQLRLLLRSKNDPDINTLVNRSEDDSTLGTLGLGTSVVASLVCLALPSTQIHLGSLNIAAPYLPVQIPALAIGVVAAFFTNAAGAAQYEAVQRYNAPKARPGPVTWDLLPVKDHLAFGLTYHL